MPTKEHQPPVRKNNKKKEILVFIVIIIAISLIISVILLFNHKDQGTCSINEKIINCIASKSILIASPTCPHCAEQKQILGGNITCFNVIETTDSNSTEIINKYKIVGVPAWIIDEKVNYGVKTLDELKQLTGC
jgi:glutaredoxin